MINEWLLTQLVCPQSKEPLQYDGKVLKSTTGYTYPIVDGIPILLFDDGDITHPAFIRTLNYTDQYENSTRPNSSEIDWYVQEQIAATNGNLYAPLINKLEKYPIPHMRISQAKNDELLLDIGCNWGRWSISASKLGYQVIGLDPNIDAVLAAKRVCEQLGITSIHFVVGDARYLPFKPCTFDYVFSYSVLQHLSKDNVKKCLQDVQKVLKAKGTSVIQLPNKYGIRNIYNQLRGVNKPDNIFRVRYWTLSELNNVFTEIIGKSEISVDGFFGLGIQPSDKDIMPYKYKFIIQTSEALRLISHRFTLLTNLADSVYITSYKPSNS